LAADSFPDRSGRLVRSALLSRFDGVFDWSGSAFLIRRERALRRSRFFARVGLSVVLNTGRGVDDVRDYCRSYGLPGGLAEYGNVFVDEVTRSETVLGDPEALRSSLAFAMRSRSVARIRRSGLSVFGPGVPVCGRSHGVPPSAEVEEMLDRCGCNGLTFFAGPSAPTSSRQGRARVRAAAAVRRFLG